MDSRSTNNSLNFPYVSIVEQPASNVVKFIEEGLPPEIIPGASSSLDNQTFPTIQILGYEWKKVVVVVSCVTATPPYRPHPHKLTGMESCKNGVCSAFINNKNMSLAFTSLCIQYIGEAGVEASLNSRQAIQVDPFKTGFSHKLNRSSIDLNCVRLCFQVFLESQPGLFRKPLQPVVSEPIFNTGSQHFENFPRNNNIPFVKILEQPASKALRFRYECEGRSAGSLPGANSTAENKTIPTIQIVGFKGKAIVVVSCVTKDRPYKPHPHNLVGKDGCKDGICTVEVNNENMIVSFANLGIQCIKKKDIDEALMMRKKRRIDPFQTGFSHSTQASSIDLNSVRLCFQVLIYQNGKLVSLQPVVSDPIYDKKAIADLEICSLSHSSGSCVGGEKIILLCEKVSKDDISVRFFEESNGQTVWEGYGDFTATQVHKQVAITFKTPKYKSLDIEEPVEALIQLRRPSDNATSIAVPFIVTPLYLSPSHQKKRKRKWTETDIVELSHLDEGLTRNIPDLSSVIAEEMSPSSYSHYGAQAATNILSPYDSRTPSPASTSVYQQSNFAPTSGTAYQPFTVGFPAENIQPATELFNMDSQQCNVQLNSFQYIDSKDLTELGAINGTNLLANFSASVSLNEAMTTDSFTNLANKTLNELCGNESFL